MPLRWDELDIADQAEQVIDMIPGLTDAEIEQVYEEWSNNRYDRSINGERQAIADLMTIARRTLMQKMGKWDSYVARMKARKGK